jgi:uncharacterized protein YbaP (TraB family)
VWPLEDARTVDALLGSIPIELQNRLLLRVASDLDLAVARTAKLVDGWYQADLGQIEAASQEMPNELYERLLVRRNEWWADSIVQGMDKEPDALVLVGCGHVAGTDNLIAKLAERGVYFERIAAASPRSP